MVNGAFHISDVLAHRLVEMKRQINFSLYYKSYFPFTLPQKVHLYINDISQRIIQKKLNYLENSEEKDNTLIDLIKQWQFLENHNIAFTNKDKNTKISQILQQAFFNYFIANYIIDINDTILSTFPAFKELAFSVFEKIILLYHQSDNLINLDEFISFTTDLENKMPKAKYQLGDQLLELGIGDSSLAMHLISFNNFYNFFSQFFNETFLISSNELSFNLGENLVKVIEYYSQTVQITDYLNFFFPALSSGEQGFLTLFSRFYSLIDPLQVFSPKVEDKDKNLIILIDEGDLYFHPKWQSEFINYINKILPNIFPRKKLQIILTSHSQFIASDLPVNHLLFLRKGKEKDSDFSDGTKAIGLCSVEKGPELTFAANIHDLLADSFFLEGAHIGEFAKSIIYNLLDIFEKKEISIKYTETEIEAIINTIGEQWIVKRLLEKFEEYKTSNSNK